MKVLLHTQSSVLGIGFLQVLSNAPGMEAHVVSGSIGDLGDAIARLRPRVTLIDFNADFECCGLADLIQKCPHTDLVLWTQSVSLEFAHHAKEVGVRGILRKDASTELLVRCLEKIGEGEFWYDRTLLNSLLGTKQVRLSPRERQLLTLVPRGLSNKQLAAALSIAEGTIKVYLSKLFRKVGVSDRYELALYGLRNQGLGVSHIPDSHTGSWTARSFLVVQSTPPQ